MEDIEDSAELPDDPKPVRLSLHMMVKRHLPPEAQKWTDERILEALNQITHLRLDREHIREIDSLELLGPSVTNVYLQRNQIETIQNFECLRNLSFLTLAGNRISTVKGLSHLEKLHFLDLSENLIKKFDIDEFPQSLIILNLKDNPCTQLGDHRGRIIQDLENLRQLNEMEITKEEKREAGFVVSSDSEEEEDEEDPSETQHADYQGGAHQDLRSLTSQMLLKSQKRLEECLREHKRHCSQLDDIRLKSDLPPSSARSSVLTSARSTQSQVPSCLENVDESWLLS